MKTLENNILLYDCDCPMCNLYSGAFIKTGMLDNHGRMPYHQMTSAIRNIIDVQRSRNEIALIDTKSNQVHYGLDSLITILGNNFPIIRILFRFKPLYWFMQKVYSFISYNRKVIAPSRSMYAEGACVPDYHIAYRIAFIILSSFFVAWTLHLYFGNISYVQETGHTQLSEWLIAIGQLLFQGLMIRSLSRERIIGYLGHVMVISVMGSLLLLPAILFSSVLLECSEFLYIGYFVLPVSIMLWQHIRRVEILHLKKYVTLTWVAHRVLVFLGFLLVYSKFLLS